MGTRAGPASTGAPQHRGRTALVAQPEAERVPHLAAWVAAVTAALGVLTAVLGVTTPARSGPMCQLDECVTFPYTDVAAHVPRDYLWLYPAIMLVVAFLLLVAILAAATAAPRRAYAAAALSFATLGAALLVADYGLQLFVAQPSLVAGEGESLTLISQYNPRGIFIALENLGYAALAVCYVCVGLTLTGPGRLVAAVRWVFVGGGALTWAAMVGLAIAYGADLTYRFELAAISVHWLVAVSTGLMLAIHFRRLSSTDGARA